MYPIRRINSGEVKEALALALEEKEQDGIRYTPMKYVIKK